MKKLFALALLASASLAHAGEAITVYKSAYCGCCAGWVEHMKKAGFEVKTIDLEQAALEKAKAERGVPTNMTSCHTAVVDKTGQVIEGHVPAAAVMKLIASPKVKGIAVPGMPMNSPGMGQMDGKLVTVTLDGKDFSKD